MYGHEDDFQEETVDGVRGCARLPYKHCEDCAFVLAPELRYNAIRVRLKSVTDLLRTVHDRLMAWEHMATDQNGILDVTYDEQNKPMLEVVGRTDLVKPKIGFVGCPESEEQDDNES